MKLKSFVSILMLAAVMMVFFGCDENGDKPFEEPNFDHDIILHTRWPFPVGVAVPGPGTVNIPGGASANNALLPDNPQHQFLKHFNVVVAENEMKPDALMPESRPNITGTGRYATDDADFNTWKANYRWDNARALVDFAQANNKLVRGHTLIWHAQTPLWFFRNPANSGQASIDQLYLHMDMHIRTVMEKFAEKIHSWDVVNEVIGQRNSGPRAGATPADGEDSWYSKIMIDGGKTGNDIYEFVLFAFQRARHWADFYHDTAVQLYLTDFGVERPFNRSPPTSPNPNPWGWGVTSKQADFKALVEWLIEKGAPIDGVGFQGHFRLYDHPVSQISEGIDMFSDIVITQSPPRKIMVQICELDFSIFSGAKNENQNTTIDENLLGERLSDLAQNYRDFFDMFEEKYKAGRLNMVLIWGIADGHSWLNTHPVPGRTDYPLLFNRNYRAKEAYIKLVENRPVFPQ
jgi:endo-1,4-beta-xylanase